MLICHQWKSLKKRYDNKKKINTFTSRLKQNYEQVAFICCNCVERIRLSECHCIFSQDLMEFEKAPLISLRFCSLHIAFRYSIFILLDIGMCISKINMLLCRQNVGEIKPDQNVFLTSNADVAKNVKNKIKN